MVLLPKQKPDSNYESGFSFLEHSGLLFIESIKLFKEL